MKPIKDFLGLFLKPFPEELSVVSYLKKLIALSFFVFLFLVIFQPFGIGDLSDNKILVCLGFALMTFLGAILYEFSLGMLMRRLGFYKNWTFGKWILTMSITTVFISTANFIFARLFIFGYIQWDFFPQMVYGTVSVGIIPVFALGAFLLFIQNKKYEGIAKEINDASSISKFKSKKGVSIYGIDSSQIRFVEALQNYVKIAHVDPEGQLQIHTERSTLKQVMLLTGESYISQCHRSFLVNRQCITSISGNAQGLLLSVQDTDVLVPVSRTFVSSFRA